jgi:hypothetical protein
MSITISNAFGEFARKELIIQLKNKNVENETHNIIPIRHMLLTISLFPQWGIKSTKNQTTQLIVIESEKVNRSQFATLVIFKTSGTRIDVNTHPRIT